MTWLSSTEEIQVLEKQLASRAGLIYPRAPEGLTQESIERWPPKATALRFA